ncbi:MAG: DNA-binding protein [Nanoarchaeota archaeon]|nr:DNA-binding protein [Nanoarchaeota archaeon]
MKINKVHVIRLKKGEEIVSKLTDFCSANKISNGIVYAIGAVSAAELALYRLEDKKYFFKTFDEPMEICSLNGNVTLLEKKPTLHLHIVLGDEQFETFGGHLKRAVVSATCEATIIELDSKIKRKYDEEIGLNLLDI